MLPTSLLKAHERTSARREREVMAEIASAGGVHPLVVSEDFVVLDGHHRLACLKRIGIGMVPAVVVDYSGGGVSVSARRRRLPVSKELVMRVAESGRLLPCKSTRHLFRFKLPVDRVALPA
ncbi:MAG: ParB N-terminal domain-containing protein [Candidatus Micrarchaeota archaeon]